ncbi:MAG TPA: alpha/beta hydrolase [Rhodopila sp.]
MKIVLLTAVLLILASYATAVGLLALLQRRLLYIPETSRPDLTATGIMVARELTVRTESGLDLLAWHAAPDGGSQPVVLYLHGNGGHIGYRASRLAELSSYGWGVLLLEYRGFGGNPGTPTETGLYEDARAAYSTLRQLGIAARRIVLWGESLGSGVAVHLASEVEVGAVLLESPYTSITAVAQKRFPFVPVAWLLRDRFDLISRIGAVHAPVLMMTGGRDSVVPPAMGQAVFAAANQPKVFWLAPEAGHNDLARAGAFTTVRSFIAAHWLAAI